MDKKTYGREASLLMTIWAMGLATHFYFNADQPGQLELIKMVLFLAFGSGAVAVGLKTAKHINQGPLPPGYPKDVQRPEGEGG